MEFAKIIQSQAAGIVLLDTHFCIQFLNESAEVLLNVSINRRQGAPISTLYHENPQLLNACRKALDSEGEVRLRNLRLKLISSNHEINMDCIINPVECDAKDMLLLELNEVESTNKISRDEAFVNRQQSNQAVIRGLAHEIRNPLGGIKGAAQLLADEVGSEQYQDYTKIIIQEVERLSNLVNRMQAQSAVDFDQPVNIHSVIEHVRQLITVDGNPEFSIIKDYDPSLPMVFGHSDLLVQALMNVVRNAAEAVASKGKAGKILLRTRIDHHVLSGQKKQVVRLEVHDNGNGIDSQLASQIFDPMVTNKPDGTGLGLPIAAEIIAQHGGTIDFLVNQDQTIFRFFLPVHEDAGADSTIDSDSRDE